jgi:glutathione S-transferase
MSGLVLHQYAESLFSEKVRLLLGYKQASYQQVEIPIIMPRPDTIPLTGGYRKTPVLQIGADVYCDTALICRVIDEIYPENSIYPVEHAGTIAAFSHWTDTFLFGVSVGLAFQPKAMASNPLFPDESTANAFAADRAELSKGANPIGVPFEAAEPHFLAHLNNLDIQLEASGGYLFGGTPSIADFSTYHVCWFIYKREVLRDYFEPFEHLMTWYKKMEAFGHGDVSDITGGEALRQATAVEPEEIVEAVFLDNLSAGQTVSVTPVDYGFQPVTGELLAAGLDEIAVARTDEQVGRVVVHFPRLGFQINP